jgi:hypothetical protein
MRPNIVWALTGGAVTLLGVAVFVYVAPGIYEAFASGLGLRTAAIISFFVTMTCLVILGAVSGDGMLGELPTMIGGFFLFFLFFWLMTAWVF